MMEAGGGKGCGRMSVRIAAAPSHGSGGEGEAVMGVGRVVCVWEGTSDGRLVMRRERNES